MDKILNKLSNIEEIVKDYPILILKNEDLKEDYSIKSSEEMKRIFDDYKTEGKLLKIAIVGSVKAGKSTLLNSLVFNSQNILPKAATPMTAALTEIAYSDKYRLTVEYFSEKEIKEIEKNSKLYEKLLSEKLTIAIKEAKEKAEKKNKEFTLEKEEKIKSKIIKNFKYDIDGNIIPLYESLQAANEQYQIMQNRNIDIRSLETNTVIEVNSLSEIQERMNEYVGVNGKYMPFTKSTRIELNIETLKNIEIVDTPGLNDPIISRSNRTKALLKECDVVLVVSQSGALFSNEDYELVKNLQLNQGVKEIYLIGSQIDTQLIRPDHNKDLYKDLEEISNTLLSQFNNNLEFTNLFRGNIELVSGMCESIKVNYDDIKSNTDEEHVLNLLCQEYPNYFKKEDKDLTLHSLDRVANISKVKNILNTVRDKKEEIIKEKLNELLSTEKINIDKYVANLILYIDNEIEKIQSADIDEIIKEIKDLNRGKKKLNSQFSFEYDNIITELKQNVRSIMNNIISKKSAEIENSISSSESTETNSERVKSSGFFAGVSRFFGLGGYETVHYKVRKFNTAPVKQKLSLLKETVEQELIIGYEQLMTKFKKEVSSIMVQTVTDNISLDNIEPSEIKSSIISVVNKFEIPQLKYDNDMSSLLNYETTITGSLVDEYMGEAYEYLTNFTKSYYSSLNKIISDIDTNLLNINPLDKVIVKIDEILEQLKNNVSNKEEAINNFNNAKEMLENINE